MYDYIQLYNETYGKNICTDFSFQRALTILAKLSIELYSMSQWCLYVRKYVIVIN